MPWRTKGRMGRKEQKSRKERRKYIVSNLSWPWSGQLSWEPLRIGVAHPPGIEESVFPLQFGFTLFCFLCDKSTVLKVKRKWTLCRRNKIVLLFVDIVVYFERGGDKIVFGLVWTNSMKTEYQIIIRPLHIRLSILSSSASPSVHVSRVQLLEKTGTSHNEQIRQCIVSPCKALYFVAKCLAPSPQNIILLNTAKVPQELDIVFF